MATAQTYPHAVDLYTIVLERDLQIDARKYGPPLASLLGIPLLESRLLLRRGRGILLEDLPEEQALPFLAVLTRDHVPARAIRNADLPLLPPPQRVGLIERTSETLRFPPTDDNAPRELPWGQIDVVSLGVIALPAFTQETSSAHVLHMPGLHNLHDDPAARDVLRENLILEATQPPSRLLSDPTHPTNLFETIQAKYSGKLQVLLDFISVTRALWLRIPMDQVAYAREENSMKLGESWGFSTLVNDVRKLCAPAFTETSLKFDDHADPGELVFLQLEEFNRYTLWHAILHYLGIKPCPNADSSSASPEPPESSTAADSSPSSPKPAPPSTSL